MGKNKLPNKCETCGLRFVKEHSSKSESEHYAKLFLKL